MAPAILTHFAKGLEGRRCDVERREHDWSFDFGGGCVLEVAAAWRLLDKGAVAFADRDYEAERVKTWPLGSDSAPERLIKRRRIETVELDEATGDLTIVFDGDLRLQIFNNSATYEGWQAHFAVDGQLVALVGQPGGGIAYLSAAPNAPLGKPAVA